ncbi:hypothetical protein B0O80DRAFT_14903 [Mortierella sp. GBAus27b]|nr:hypothetical protein B0O80DRAFT_14903 [Mortierella sp. GBAus27b]
MHEVPSEQKGGSILAERVQKILSSNNATVRSSKGNSFRYITDAGLWTMNMSPSPDSKPSYQLSRNASMTTTTVTPTPSTSSLSVISSVVGSSLTAGIMEQVSTWRTGAETDDDDEASLEIYSNPSMNRASFPSQNSRESHGSGGSLLNGMEIMPTLHLQFPQHPLDQPDDNDTMPPPSSTSGYRRHSMSSHQRPLFGRMKRSSQDDNLGDSIDLGSSRTTHQALTAEILARSVRLNESRHQGSKEGSADHGSMHTLINKSGFPSPQSTTPSPRIPTVQNFIQPSSSASVRGESETHRRSSSSHSGQLRLSPNQLETRQRTSLGRRSMDEVNDEDDPMDRDTPRPLQAPSPRFAKEDLRLRDLGASLQKSLSFNGEDEYQEMNRDDERQLNHGRLQSSVRHHPYQARPRGAESNPQRLQSERHVQRPTHGENFIRDRRERTRAIEREEDREIMGKTPVLLNAINTSMTNILSEIQNSQRQNQGEIAHFREELYQSLQQAFTQVADQLEGVGRAVSSIDNSNRETIRQLAHSIGEAIGTGFTTLTESLEQKIHLQIQQQMQQIQPYRPPSSRPSSIVGPSNSNSRPRFGSPVGREGNSSGGSYDDHDDDGADHGRNKRRAVERPRSTSGSRKTMDRPRREFEN